MKVKLHYNRKGFIQDIVLLLEVEKGIEFKFPCSPIRFPLGKKSGSNFIWVSAISVTMRAVHIPVEFVASEVECRHLDRLHCPTGHGSSANQI